MKAPMNDALRDTLIRYLFTLPQRKRVQTAVCDAVEVFCERRCEWVHASANGPGINVLVLRPMWHPGYYPGRHFLHLPAVCPYCKHETFERFEILEGGGV